MDKKRLYGIMESIDSCMIEVEKVCRIVSLFKAGFEMRGNNDGECAAGAILDYLEPVEGHLARIYTEVDSYIIDNK